MDTAGRFAAWKNAISGSFMTPNEARLEEDRTPIAGGDTLYMQQQNYSLEALSARDKEQIKNPGAATAAPPAKPLPAGGDGGSGDDTSPPDDAEAKVFNYLAARVNTLRRMHMESRNGA
jgi:phage portal protein BeeE